MIRPVALLALALTFPAVALGDAYAGDHCPHHDTLPVERPAAGDAGHTGHVGHADHGLVADDSGESGTHGQAHGGPCTCLGQCVTQVGVALPSPAMAVAAAVAPATSARAVGTASQWAAIDPPYLQPYANAPPSSR